MRIHQVCLRFSCVILLQWLSLGIFLPNSVLAIGVTLSWDQALAADPTGYYIYHRTCHAGSGCTGIGAVSDLGNLIVPLKNLTDSSAPHYRLEDLPSRSDFVFVVTAYTDTGLESDFPNKACYRALITSPDDHGSEVDETPPFVPPHPEGIPQTHTRTMKIVLTWVDGTDDVGVSDLQLDLI